VINSTSNAGSESLSDYKLKEAINRGAWSGTGWESPIGGCARFSKAQLHKGKEGQQLVSEV